jgi:hypothetical protein
MEAETRYARTADSTHVAYQVTEGRPDGWHVYRVASV